MKTKPTAETRSLRKWAQWTGAVLLLVLVAPSLAVGQSPSKKQSRVKQRTPIPPDQKIHIPPIDMEAGSFTIYSKDQIGDAEPNDRVMSRNRPKKHRLASGEVRFVRILGANGDMVFNGYKNDKADRATIEIWFDGSTSDADLMVRKESAFVGGSTIEAHLPFGADNSSSHSRHMRMYPNNEVQIARVRITNTKYGARTYCSGSERQIAFILVWTYEK